MPKKKKSVKKKKASLKKTTKKTTAKKKKVSKKKPVKKKTKRISKKKPVKKTTSKKNTYKKRTSKKNNSKRKAVKRKTSPKKIVRKKKTHKKKSVLKKLKKKFKSKKEKRVAMGLPRFDKMSKGGFERNSINLVSGRSGSGKSIFAMQFLMQGIKEGGRGLYVTFEEKKQDFFLNMKKLGWDLEKLEKEGKFVFLEYSPEKVKMMLDEGGGAIESLVYKHNIKRLVFDSISSFSLLFDDVLSRRQATLGLFDIIDKWDCTTLFTVQHDSNNYDEELSSIEFEADSITRLHFRNIKNKRLRFIEILKMRGVNHSTEIHSFKIKKGIKIGPKSKITIKGLK